MVLPSHPERSAGLAPSTFEWSHRSFWPWFVVLLSAGVGGGILTAVTVPSNDDMFESLPLYASIGVIAVLCGFAGWFVPAGCPYWGLVPAPPYLVVFLMGLADHPADDPDFSFVGILFLAVLLAIPWAIGFSAGVSRKALR
jgi:hypothetical protein